MQVSGQGQMLVSVSCYVMSPLHVVPDVGVYVFPCLTLLGFDKQDPVVARLQGLGVRLEDHDRRCEGLEVASSSPFHLIRTLATGLGYEAVHCQESEAPGELPLY